MAKCIPHGFDDCAHCREGVRVMMTRTPLEARVANAQSFLTGKGLSLPIWDDGERQAILLALAHLSVDRPGWDHFLNTIALRIDNDRLGRASLFDDFRLLATPRRVP